MEEAASLYTSQDAQAYGNVLVLRYSKLDYNRHKHGFENGVAPLIRKHRSQGVDTIVLDLEQTAHIESLTLGTIVRFNKDFTQLGVSSIRIANPSEMLETVFADQNLDKIFGPLFPNLEKAIKELQTAGK